MNITDRNEELVSPIENALKASTVDDLDYFLSAWQATSSPVAVRNPIEFINQNLDSLTKKSKLANSFWDKREVQMIQVRDWLLNPLTHGVLLQNPVIRADEMLANELSKAIKQLQNRKVYTEQRKASTYLKARLTGRMNSTPNRGFKCGLVEQLECLSSSKDYSHQQLGVV